VKTVHSSTCSHPLSAIAGWFDPSRLHQAVMMPMMLLFNVCHDADSWRLNVSPLVSVSNSTCLDAFGVGANQRLALKDCDSSPLQKWQYFHWDYSIRPAYSTSLCMATAATEGATSFTPVVLAPCLPVTPSSQQWFYDSSRGGVLTPRNSARVCLALDNRRQLILLACTGAAGQRWTVGAQGS
jgi:hypothetical protein